MANTQTARAEGKAAPPGVAVIIPLDEFLQQFGPGDAMIRLAMYDPQADKVLAMWDLTEMPAGAPRNEF